MSANTRGLMKRAPYTLVPMRMLELCPPGQSLRAARLVCVPGRRHLTTTAGRRWLCRTLDRLPLQALSGGGWLLLLLSFCTASLDATSLILVPSGSFIPSSTKASQPVPRGIAIDVHAYASSHAGHDSWRRRASSTRACRQEISEPQPPFPFPSPSPHGA